ncbi:uncharacterized protein LOC116182240 [Photinus pyralis]|uniref:uncharacterized protein LOC116182240 n=1 Tax=Photinus pyralis TaxID=7054 RepID=UPI0012670299|nr:uncharacterized protein LOC116182240 [Photinus pyralis]
MPTDRTPHEQTAGEYNLRSKVRQGAIPKQQYVTAAGGVSQNEAEQITPLTRRELFKSSSGPFYQRVSSVPINDRQDAATDMSVPEFFQSYMAGQKHPKQLGTINPAEMESASGLQPHMVEAGYQGLPQEDKLIREKGGREEGGNQKTLCEQEKAMGKPKAFPWEEDGFCSTRNIVNSNRTSNHCSNNHNVNQLVTDIVSQVIEKLQQSGQVPNTRLSRNDNVQGFMPNPDMFEIDDRSACEDAIRKFNKFDINKRLPIFDNKGMVHPLEFLEQVDCYYNLNKVPYSYFRMVVANQFRGEALSWSQTHMHTFSNFDEFKAGFRDFFWSDVIQSECLYNLEKNKYYASMGSFSQHFMRSVALAKHISYPEHFIIQKLSRNYPPHIATHLVGMKRFADAIGRLRQAEYYFAPEVKNVEVEKQISNREVLQKPRFQYNRNSWGDNAARAQESNVFRNKNKFDQKIPTVEVQSDSLADNHDILSGNDGDSHEN